MSSTKLQDRIAGLFSDLDIPSIQPDQDGLTHGELPQVQDQVVEKNLPQIEQPASEEQYQQVAEKAPLSSPILYEKEHLGFAWSEDHLERTNLNDLPDLDDAQGLKATLVESSEVIGELFVESSPERPLGSDELSLAKAIAQQASLQIQNLRLLDAAQRARAEAISATRQFTHESWQNFLDAIHEREHIGFVYDQQELRPFEETAASQVDFTATVSVLEEQIGAIYLQTRPDQPLTEQDRALVQAVARQVAQQVENLRLLADASRARATAEEATRLITAEGWQKYAQEREDANLGFVYDRNRVLPIQESTLPARLDIAQPLTVRGEIVGQLAVAGLRDISQETKELIAAIAERTSVHLETLRLNEELQKRAAQLQELDRLKSSFLANMSHELRTPLNSILGFSEVMLEGIDGPLTDYMENDLRLIQKNGQHLLRLINDVLDMAKIESGRMNLHPETFKIHDLFEEVISITSSLANAKNLDLLIERGSNEEIEIFADNTRISQVMINLVNNAIKFTEIGAVTIKALPLGRDRVLITVKDTGLGIPADHLEAIFQEFSQVDTSTTRKVGGTGLGLPISRRLVELHGGRLWAESKGEPGQGSTFYIELPLEAKITESVEAKNK
jgi:signal transduction histidine kinase